MNVAIYVRVSTNEQNPDMQLKDLREYCERMQYDIYREYIDIGESGAKTSRPQLDMMLQDMRHKLFDAVIDIIKGLRYYVNDPKQGGIWIADDYIKTLAQKHGIKSDEV